MAGNHEMPADVGTPHGVARHSHGFTDFTAHTHAELYSMLFASDPASLRESAAAWQSTGLMLTDQAAQLKHQLINFSQMWQGQAADEYKTMITDLANGLEKVGDNALAMNDLMSSSADALDTARAEMPAPSSVPDLDPQVMAAATATPAPEVAMDPAASAQFQQNQAQAQQAVQAHQAQVAAAQASQARAVQVMQTLATSYSSDEDQVPSTPESVATGPTGTPDSSTGVPVVGATPSSAQILPGLTAPTGPGTPDGLIGAGTGTGTAPSASIPASPLFGHMFTAGLAAASAAASGRFGSVMPRLPSFLNPRSNKAKQTAADAAAAARAATTRLPSGMAGAGLGGIGGGGGIGVAGAGGPSPTAYAGLIGGGGSAGIAAGSLAGPAAAAGAAGAPGASGMPMMPMGAMGAGAGSELGGRRIPPWLVETEDVWGESSAVAPPVIGEDL